MQRLAVGALLSIAHVRVPRAAALAHQPFPRAACPAPRASLLTTPTMAAAEGGVAAAVDVSDLPPRARAVLDYWLGEGWEAAPAGDTRPNDSKKWFMGGPEVDGVIIEQFGADCEALLAGELEDWRARPLSTLAAIIVGDQFSRNAYRGVSA